MDSKKIDAKLESLIGEGEAVCATRKRPAQTPGVIMPLYETVDSKLFKEWSLNALSTLRSIFGEESDHYRHAAKAAESTWQASDADNLLSIVKSALTTFREDLGSAQPESGQTDAIPIVNRICERFHQVARQLRARHAERQTLDITDEYDVQDLLRAILTISFDDIREEEGTPSVAGAATRMDFLLKNERLVVETKMTRKGLGAREVGEELIIDIAKYKSHPDCSALVCFVYDPDGRIKNPAGVESDLESMSSSELTVKVFIRPR